MTIHSRKKEYYKFIISRWQDYR